MEIIIEMNLNPFLNLLNSILSLYSTGFIIWIILSWLIRFQIINGYQSFVQQVMKFCYRVFEPPLVQIRKIIPSVGGVDLSPIILLLLLNFVREFLFTYLYKV